MVTFDLKTVAQPLCDPHPKFSLEEPVTRFHKQYTDIPPCVNLREWYQYNDSETVFVFVHGIIGDNRDTWFYPGSGTTDPEYWPELVRIDNRFNNPSIFLVGYPTEIESSIFDIRAVGRQIFSSLNSSMPDGKPSVLETKKNIVFVAHSTGGIAVRHMLTRPENIPLFEEKAIGVVLVASPTLGSIYADIAGDSVEHIDTIVKSLKDYVQPLISLVFGVDEKHLKEIGFQKNAIAEQLKWYNIFLLELRKDFDNLRNANLLPHMSGIALIEDKFVHDGLSYTLPAVVNPESGGQHFEAIPIGGSNHITIAKPPKIEDGGSHFQLGEFFTNGFQDRIFSAAKEHSWPRIMLMDSYTNVYDRPSNIAVRELPDWAKSICDSDNYDPIAEPGEMNSHVIRDQLVDSNWTFDIEPLYPNWDNAQELFRKREPNLIVVHHSSFNVTREGILIKTRKEKRKRLRGLLKRVLQQTEKTKILIYSREKTTEAKLADFFENNERWSNRIYGFKIKQYCTASQASSNSKCDEQDITKFKSFKNGCIIEDLRTRIEQVLSE